METANGNLNIAPITLPVPPAFRTYLIRRQNYSFLISFLLILYASVHTQLHHRHGWNFMDETQNWWPPAIVALLWYGENLKENARAWKYVFGPTSIQAIGYGLGGWSWRWYSIEKARNAVFSIEQTQWRGFPALRVTAQVNKSRFHQKLLIVYSRDESETVSMQVIPMVANYQRIGRQKVWYQKS